MSGLAGQVGLTALVAALALGVEHYFPWRMVLGRDLPRPAAYVLGVLAIIVPLSGLYLVWALDGPQVWWAHLAGLWAVMASGGMTVLGAYGLDWVLGRARTARELEEVSGLAKEAHGERKTRP